MSAPGLLPRDTLRASPRPEPMFSLKTSSGNPPMACLPPRATTDGEETGSTMEWIPPSSRIPSTGRPSSRISNQFHPSRSCSIRKISSARNPASTPTRPGRAVKTNARPPLSCCRPPRNPALTSTAGSGSGEASAARLKIQNMPSGSSSASSTEPEN